MRNARSLSIVHGRGASICRHVGAPAAATRTPSFRLVRESFYIYQVNIERGESLKAQGADVERRHSMTFYFVGAACTLFFAHFRCQRESEGNAVEKAEVCPCSFILLSVDGGVGVGEADQTG